MRSRGRAARPRAAFLRFALFAAALCGGPAAARADDFGLDDAEEAAADPWAGVTQLFPDPATPSGKGFGEGRSPAPSLEFVGEFDLPDSAPEGLSGIAWLGNTPGMKGFFPDDYLLVEDSGGRLHSATIGIDRGTGAITNAVVSPAGAIPGAADLEGVACGGPCDERAVAALCFASDERGPEIRMRFFFDPPGAKWWPVSLPEALKGCRPNLALESLALSADGRLLWTANEGPLPEDGPEPTAKHGSRVRLYALDAEQLLRGSADASLASTTAGATQSPPPWWFYPLDPATGTSLPHLPAPFNGLAELCALPDGRLLALERSFGFRTRSSEDPRGSLITISIYLIDPLHAEFAALELHAESAEFAALELHAESAERAGGALDGGGSGEAEPPTSARTAAAQRPPVLAKTLLWRGLTGRSNYEGMTLGPVLSDGSRALLLVADGDVTRKGSFSFPWRKSLLAFRLDLP